MGPSGSGKTSLLRAIAGLWRCGRGTVRIYLRCCEKQHHNVTVHNNVDHGEATTSTHVFGEIEEENNQDQEDDPWHGSTIFFVPQNPYMVHGSLRQQLLYPAWISSTDQTTGKLLKRPLSFQFWVGIYMYYSTSIVG